MPTFCRVLAGLLAFQSVAWVTFAVAEQRRSYHPPLVILGSAWALAGILCGLRANGARSGGAPWTAATVAAAGSLVWGAWKIRALNAANVNPGAYLVTGAWFGALVTGLVGLALDRPPRAEDPDDD